MATAVKRANCQLRRFKTARQELDKIVVMSLAVPSSQHAPSARRQSTAALALGASPDERRRAYARARRHTVWVRLFKLMAPMLALGSLGLYAIPSKIKIEPFPGGPVVAIESVSLVDNNLKMQRPSFNGYTADKAFYEVSAATATQSFGLSGKKTTATLGLGTADDVGLEKLQAKVTQLDKSWVTLAAKAGTMRVKAQTMTMTDGIVVQSSAGMTVKLATADVDFASKLMRSDSPVVITMPTGRVQATGLDIDSNARQVVFRSNVVARLVGTGTPPTPSPQPEKRNADAFAALGQQSGPIDITAARLEIRDAEKTATFTGGVVAARPDARLMGDAMIVTYQAREGQGEGAATPATMGSAPADIARMEVIAGVQLEAKDGRNATADRLIYDRPKGTLALIGNVSVTQGPNLLTGGRIDIAIAARHTRVSGPGRVIGHFEQAGEADEPAKPSVKANDPGLGSGSGPVDVEADQLDIYDDRGLAVFRGNVNAQRGDQQIKAGELELAYVAGKDGAATGASRLQRMVARQRVSVKAPNNQIVTGDHMVYEAGSSLITVDGNVVVTRGQNVIKGDKLVIDLANGETRFVGAQPKAAGEGAVAADGTAKPKSGRIRMLITQDGARMLNDGEALASPPPSAAAASEPIRKPQTSKTKAVKKPVKTAPATPEP